MDPLTVSPIYGANNLYLNGALVKDLVIPDDVKNINAFALFTAENIFNSVTLNDELNSVGIMAFDSLPFANMNEKNGINYLGSKTNPYLYAQSIDENITQLNFEKGCKFISHSAFGIGDHQYNYESISIPSTVTSIDIGYTYSDNYKKLYIENMSSWCNISFNYFLYYDSFIQNVSEIYFNNELLTDVVIPDDIKDISCYAFNNKTIESVEIPNGVKTIGDCAFGSSSIKKMVIPDSVTSIGNSAINASINKLYLGNGLQSLGYHHFVNNPDIHVNSIDSFFKISFFHINMINYDGIPKYNLYINDKIVKNFIVPNGIDTLSGTWTQFFSFVRIELPESMVDTDIRVNFTVYEIYNKTGHNISMIWGNEECNIYTPTEGKSALTFTDDDFILFYKENEIKVVGYCGNEKSISLPNGITNIADTAFSNCPSLESVTIPNSITYIGERAFYGCTGLTSVTIPNSVTSIGCDAFSGCTGLTSITIPDSVTSIEDAFNGCTGLTTAVFKNPKGWACLTRDRNMLDNLDLSNPETAAMYLKNALLIWKQ